MAPRDVGSGVNVDVKENVSLSKLTTLGTGGPARFLGRPETVHELVELLAWADERELPVAVVGLGSNLLVADDGFPGLALKLGGTLAYVKAEGTLLVAGGGAALAVCLHRARATRLGGIEFACAIPGTVGGAVWMNAGAYGSDIGSVLVRALVATSAGTKWRTPEQLGMRYRGSDLRAGQVVAAVELDLVARPEEMIRQSVTEMQALRKAAQPTNRRTFGSVFKNPEHPLSAGRMLDACGLRGFRIGNTQVSPKHANFIENIGGGRTLDALSLIAECRGRAWREYGVVLEPEVQLLGAIAVPAVD